MDDRSLLLRAIKIAGEGIAKGGGPFGAVVVKDGKIVSEEFNRVVLDSDPTAHAEIAAIRQASSKMKSHDLNGCTIYCSCEPCPMCFGAIYWSGIRNVVYACDRHDAANAGFSDKDIYDEIALDPSDRRIKYVRLEQEEGEAVFKKWQRHENKIQY
jgi:guanine deaminase